VLSAGAAPLESVVLNAVELDISQVSLIRGDEAVARAIDAAEVPSGAKAVFQPDPTASGIRVTIDPPAKPGEVLAIAVRYSAHPRGGMYFTGPTASDPALPLTAWSQGESQDNRYWFPTWDFPDDYATAALNITAPPPLVATAVGRHLEDGKTAAGRPIARYRTEHPHATYLIAVVVGEFDLRRETWNGVTLEYRVPKGRAGQIERSFARTPQILQFMADTTGVPYPHDRYAQNCVPLFIFGGMENVTAVTLTDRTLHDDRAHPDATTALITHEAAHQWTGDLVGFADWSESWLSEGLSDYLTSLWVGTDESADALTLEWQDQNAAYLRSGRFSRPIVTRLYRAREDLFDAVLYAKGSAVLNMLRSRIGDEPFLRGLNLYLVRNAWKPARTSNLQAAFEEASGRNLDRFFDEWVYRPGHPKITASWSWRPGRTSGEAGEARVTLNQEAAGRGSATDPELFDLAVTVELLWPDGHADRRRMVFDGKEAEVRIPAPVSPAALIVDPDSNLVGEIVQTRERDELLAVIAHSKSAPGRVDALKALGALPATDAGTAGIVAALRGDPVRGVRKAAASALGAVARTDGPAAAQARKALLEAAASEPDSRVRVPLVEGVGGLQHDREAGALLLRLLKSDRSWAVQGAAAGGLPTTRPPEAFEALSAALKTDSPNEVVRKGVLAALAAQGDPRAGVLLHGRVGARAPIHTRPAAAEALAAWAKKQESPEQRRLALEALTVQLGDAWYLSRASAIRALGVLGEGAAIPDLERIEGTDFDDRARGAAATALDQIAAASAEKTTGGAAAKRIEALEKDQATLRGRIEALEKQAAEKARGGEGEAKGTGTP